MILKNCGSFTRLRANNQISINEFCLKRGIEYTKFYAWYKRTKKQVVPVTIEGVPTLEPEDADSYALAVPTRTLPGKAKGDIMVMIQTRGGLKISQTNLDYQGLKKLVENLEVLC